MTVPISFLLNGTPVTLDCPDPMVTLLDWLREARGLTGTKEGCNEGDCGACSVIVTDESGAKPLNACILFLPQINGKAVRTVEGVAAPDGRLHPVQQAMIDHHGSQCGFCTPGFVTTMACNHLNGARDHATALAGNLCRCTGYAPILRAAQAAQEAPVPDHMRDGPYLHLAQNIQSDAAASWIQPRSSDDLATWYAAHPEATLVAGATDVGLWVTKGFFEARHVAFLNQCADLKGVSETDEALWIGAATTLAEVQPVMDRLHPSFGQMIRRYGSAQVRAAATLGGNIANGSPIGDAPPALIVLGAELHMRKGAVRRSRTLQEFFIDYGKQDLAPGEFVTGITIPKHPVDRLKCYKLSKRFDQDISAVCGALWISVEDGHVTEARLAYGGMAGIPKRAASAEAALVGQPWLSETLTAAMDAMSDDFSPLSDMRASADYRMQTARNMLQRYWLEDQGQTVQVLA